MRKYRIANPGMMREAVLMMKDERAAVSAENVAAVWSVATRIGKPAAFTVYIKLGRSATLCRLSEGREIVLGGMRLNDARVLVQRLDEYTGGE